MYVESDSDKTTDSYRKMTDNRSKHLIAKGKVARIVQTQMAARLFVPNFVKERNNAIRVDVKFLKMLIVYTKIETRRAVKQKIYTIT